MHTRTALFVAFFALTGCVGSDPNGPSGPSGSNAPNAGQPAPAPLGCLGILTCVSTNDCSDDACVNDCMGKGSAEAQRQVTDLATCYQNAGCTDSTCLQTNCKPELATCLAGSAPAPTGSPMGGGSAPQGSVPADMVGTWIAGNAWDLSSEKELVLGADGSGEYIESYNGALGQCSSAVIAKYQGTAVVDATTITLYATTVTETTNTCSTPNVQTQPAKTLSFTYAPSSVTSALNVTDADCAAQYPDQGSIDTYCEDSYYKQ